MNNQTGKIFMLLGAEQSGRKTLANIMSDRIEELRIIEDYIIFDEKDSLSTLFCDYNTQIITNEDKMNDLIKENRIMEYKYLNCEYRRAAFPLRGYSEGLKNGDFFITYANLYKVRKFKEIFESQFRDCIIPIYIYSTSVNNYSSRHKMIQESNQVPYEKQYSSGNNLISHSLQSINGELDEIKKLCDFEVLNDDDIEVSATKLMDYIKKCL